jgi:hypothetical protein
LNAPVFVLIFDDDVDRVNLAGTQRRPAGILRILVGARYQLFSLSELKNGLVSRTSGRK